MAPIHERDVAAVAVAALSGEAGDEVSAMLTGSELLSQRRQVELVGAAIGTELRIEELSAAEARRRFGRSERPETVEAIIQVVTAAADGGSPATATVERVLGRAAAPFAQWARDHTAGFR